MISQQRSWRERIKGVAVLGLLLGVASVVAACGSSSSSSASGSATAASASSGGSSGSSSSPLVLGFSSYPPTVPAIAEAVSGATAQAKKDKIQIKFGMAADAPAQQSAIDQLLGEGANVLAIDPNDSTAITTSIKAANSKKIPVIMWVGTATGGKVATFIGSNELSGGQNVGDYVGKLLHGSGEVALINGDEVHQAFILRERGFRSELKKKYPGVTISAFGIGQQTAPPSEALARDMLTAHPNIKAIVALSDAMAAGVYQAVKAEGKTGSVAVIGYNGDCPTLKSIWDGQISATVFQNWYGFGADTVDAAVALHDGKALSQNMIEPTIVLDKQVMQQVLAGTYPSKDATLLASVKQAANNQCPKA